MIACYLELYEEGKVKHINGVWPKSKQLYSLLAELVYDELYEEGKVEHINGVWPKSKQLQLVGRVSL